MKKVDISTFSRFVYNVFVISPLLNQKISAISNERISWVVYISYF